MSLPKKYWLVLQYLLFTTRERQISNDQTAEIVQYRLGPAGPLAIIIVVEKYEMGDRRKIRT
jgi:hypothetical protein